MGDVQIQIPAPLSDAAHNGTVGLTALQVRRLIDNCTQVWVCAGEARFLVLSECFRMLLGHECRDRVRAATLDTVMRSGLNEVLGASGLRGEVLALELRDQLQHALTDPQERWSAGRRPRLDAAPTADGSGNPGGTAGPGGMVEEGEINLRLGV
jgi:hypothetical protein